VLDLACQGGWLATREFWRGPIANQQLEPGTATDYQVLMEQECPEAKALCS
jgi:hypothetical protein